MKTVKNGNSSLIVDLDKSDKSLRKDLVSKSALKFMKAVKMTEFVTHVNESDFRPFSCEYTILKNLAFVANNGGVNLDLQYDS